ncbi:DUF6896 domain-containing protein [Beggiatoa leptomitoformis]|uniref:DUF6896 domain-containing protein n=1 Tax=Beggiatoa leptomitoformis TaxID=288004 RepID=A0A2N9YE55_9GAMM|nr:hypothetical protein [Beggiatoa leptomitoformis]ALG68899.1 hypothetical protein AL038_15845 [Beggiatoa leptomitoformis]AUI68726.1 hypothetical protein BLE401_08415 [Beggiatoa leptomitoformis]
MRKKISAAHFIVHVSFFIELQRQLLRAFTRKFPNINDFELLLDFPRKGVVNIRTERWKFRKHGLGLYFRRKSLQPNYVVDMHTCFTNPYYIDSWRLFLFLESLDKHVPQNEITMILEKMVSKGILNAEKYGYQLKKKKSSQYKTR